MIQFTKATTEKCRLRMALIGVSGGGKTYTALNLAKFLGGRTVVLDSERGTASKAYARYFDFDKFDLDTHNPRHYIECIKAAGAARYNNIIIDSLSHAWSGKDGALELVDQETKRSQSGNSFAAWKKVNPLLAELLDSILTAPANVVATLRAKMEYVSEKDERGKTNIRKVGLQPVFRDQLEFEFDVVADMDMDNNLIITKTRCVELSGKVMNKPGKELAQTLQSWIGLEDGTAPKQTDTNTGVAASSSELAASAEPGKPDPKPAQPVQQADAVKDQQDNAALAEKNSASQTDTLPGTTAKVGAEEMKQLLTAGVANGWERKQISDFVCHAFKLKPETLAQSITWKQWETAVKVVSHPNNANGKVTANADGKLLPPAHHWPQEPKEQA